MVFNQSLLIFMFIVASNGILCFVNDDICGVNLKLQGFAGPRVITTSNGDTGPPGSWPWMVSAGELSSEGVWEHRCGGTIIASNLVLTAAHCAFDDRWLIRTGDRDLDSSFDDAKVITRKIKKIHVHPKYVYDLTAYYDVAIWELDEDVEYNIFHRPICLPNEPSLDLNKYEGDQVTVLGWGLQTSNGGRSDNTLKQTPVKVFSNLFCNTSHSNLDSNILQFRTKATLPNLFKDHLMCAGYELGNFGSCSGDSGGPIVRLLTTPPNIRYIQVGIVQGGVGDCGDSRYPGIYIRLDDPDILAFIQSVADPGSVPSTVRTSPAPLPIVTSPTPPPIQENPPRVGPGTIGQGTVGSGAIGPGSPDFGGLFANQAPRPISG
ncbi:hypothetical protein TCAL_12893 [Tigriopus californicus]|uniref:Peptidase S1 domain-containing protein n=1 Tax=Tigriopus californicus TaxID=6832 RepID=A0A553PPB5_TIGCA|nr:venom protease-like [Tigriopus californicus]TRY79521.1 hypothetical protein TCAL_12893 [Tigriopus californicus]|eukprot:TCALIF_12893-PA protein Name:"Similar to Venom protease (Megabombus pennsylvanicus)" AED:0.00 eAED:0.00 QI:11/1/1/1/0.8/0.66/6/248/376